MLKSFTFASIVILLVPICAVCADLDFECGIKRTFGSSKYTIEFGIDEDTKALSELEFPMDTYMLGLGFGSGFDLGSRSDLKFALSGAKSITDPKNSMTDIDKIQIPSLDINLTWSSTESDARADGYYLDFGSRVSLYKNKTTNQSLAVRIGFGYYYQKWSYDIYGVRGWQLDQFLRRQYFDVLQDTCVLKYDLKLKAPYLSFEIEGIHDNRVQLAGKFGYCPRASLEDFDDHLFRFRHATANCHGLALLGSGEVKYFFSDYPKNPRLFIHVSGDFLFNTAEGYQQQEWYGDDPAGDGDETGMVVDGIHDEIQLWSAHVRISLGITM